MFCGPETRGRAAFDAAGDPRDALHGQGAKKLGSLVKSGRKRRVLENVLEARQFALKLIANVTYGYTAASFSGRMPCVELADAIVSAGRRTLEHAIDMVQNGGGGFGAGGGGGGGVGGGAWPSNARVVYGDTDSLFVHLPGCTKEEAFRAGRAIADAVTAANPKDVVLQFEKVYMGSLLVSKKRYCGMAYEDEAQKNNRLQGLEAIRPITAPRWARCRRRPCGSSSPRATRRQGLPTRQWARMLSLRCRVSDFVVAKEVKLDKYRGRHPPPMP